MRRRICSRDRGDMTVLGRTPDLGDAFGQALARCWASGARRGVTYEVVEREDGYIGVTDAADYFADPADWSPVEQWGCEQVVDRVLDIGRGAGRHAVPLGRAGHAVVGLDASQGAVEVARARGVCAVEAGSATSPRA
jgi:SAM-dependent methyltransferase